MTTPDPDRRPPDPAEVPATPEELRRLVDVAAEMLTRTIGLGVTCVPPHVYALVRVTRPDEPSAALVYPIDAPFNEFEEKRDALRAAGAWFYDNRFLVAGVALVSEVWTAAYASRGAFDADRRAPRDHPDRREGVLVASATMGRLEGPAQVMEVTRDADNRIVPGDWRRWGYGDDDARVEHRILGHFWDGYFAEAMGHLASRN